MYEKYPDIITVSELAEIFRINISTAYQLLQRGDIPYRRVGTTYRIPKRAVILYIEGDISGQEESTVS